MDKEYREYLGLLGLRHVVNETADALERRNTPQRPRMDESFDPIGRYKNNMDDSLNNYSGDQMETDLSQETMISLVDRMRLTTFKFKITNAFEEIITPLRTEMERISFEEGQMRLRHHTEDNLYQQAIIDSLKDMSKSVEGNLIRSMVMEYQRFTRHPVWSSLRYLNAGLIQPVASGIKTILFGWKKEKSDTDRIVESINELTEFMMTGQIDRTESFMDKYIRKGLLQSMSERVLGLGGYDRAGAQRIEDMRASGQDWRIDQVLNKHRAGGTGALTDEERQIHKDLISSKIFSSIIKRGRLSPDGGDEGGRIIDITPYQADMKSIVEKVAMHTESIAKSNAMLLLSAMEGGVKMEDFFGNYERVTQSVMESVSVGQTDMITHSISTFSNNIAKQHKEQMEMRELLLDSSESVEKHTKDTAKRTRRGFGALMGIIGITLVGAIAKLGKTGLGLLGVGAGAGMAANAKNLAKRIPLISVGLGLWDTRETNMQIRDELNARGADTAEIAATLINNTSRGIIGAILDSSSGLAASAFDLVFGGDDARKLQSEFSNGFISRLKNSPDFPLFGPKWWNGVFEKINSDRFWDFGDSYVGQFVKSIANKVKEVDNFQFNQSIRALENSQQMYDAWNSMYTPVSNQPTVRPSYESEENINKTTDKVFGDLINGVNSTANAQMELNQELLESLSVLRNEIKTLSKNYKEGNSQGEVSPYTFDADALLNKIGL